ncbi:MAG: DUF342 domain-containing protein [archaeon]|nr:DUF342 domain-containing protein [archaeon]
MKTLKLTVKDFKGTDSFYEDYCGKEDVSNFDGNIEIAEELNWVRFFNLKASGNIIASNTDISALSIEAGKDIRAQRVATELEIKSGGNIVAKGWIEAGQGIRAKGNIEAFHEIEAGLSIEAGGNIIAGSGIRAGLSITSKGMIKFRTQLFAGVCVSRKMTKEDKKIRCKEIVGGTVGYGTIVWKH